MMSRGRPQLTRRVRLTVVVALTWVSLSLLPPPSETALAGGRWPRTVVRAFRTIREKECLQHVQVLASDEFEGRACGTEGGRKAAFYIADRFREMGLEPGGVDGTYFQPFAVAGVSEKPGSLQLGNGLGIQRRLGKAQERVPLGKGFVPDPRSAEGRVSGLLTYIGVQGQPPDAALDLTGRIAVVGATPSPSPPEGIEELARRGVRALIILAEEAGRAAGEKLSWPASADGGVASIPVVHVSGRGARTVCKALGVSARRLARLAADTVLETDVRATVSVTRTGFPYGRGRNVIALVRGSDPELRDEAIVIGAHFDHIGRAADGRASRGTPGKIHNGADDNASGTSGLIELAEAFAESDLKPKRTIIFIAFDAEEIGLIGSKHYVSSPPLIPIEETRAMINMDMISRNAIDVMKIGRKDAFAGLNAIVEGVAAEFHVQLDPEGMEKYMTRSDQAPFISHGVPAVFLHGGEHPDYHTERDDVDRILPAKIVNISRLMFLCAWECANHPGSFQ